PARSPNARAPRPSPRPSARRIVPRRRSPPAASRSPARSTRRSTRPGNPSSRARRRRTARARSAAPDSRSSRTVIGGPAADAEDDELRRPQRRDADETDEQALVEVVLRHGAAVAFHEVRLLRPAPEEGARAVLRLEEASDRQPHLRPERRAVRLEDRPLRATVDRLLEIGDVPPDGDIRPLRNRRRRVRRGRPD